MPIAVKVAVFYGLALAFSWGWWGWMLATGRMVGPGSPHSHLPGLFGPMIAAFATAALDEGLTGIRRLGARCLRWPTHPWLVAALTLGPPLIVAAYYGAVALAGAPLPPLSAFLAYPGLPAALSTPLVLPAVLIATGYGEETGWRGYLFPALLPSLGPFRATLLVALLWLVWHAPLFWLNASMTALVGPMLVGWAIGLILGAYVLSYLYLLSGTSLPAVVIWHAAFNLSVATPATAGLPPAIVSTAVMVWGLAIAVAWARGAQPPRIART